MRLFHPLNLLGDDPEETQFQKWSLLCPAWHFQAKALFSWELQICTTLTEEAFDPLLVKSDLFYFHLLLKADFKELSSDSLNRNSVWKSRIFSLGDLLKRQELLCLCSFWGVKQPSLCLQAGMSSCIFTPSYTSRNKLHDDRCTIPCLPFWGSTWNQLGKW